MDPIFTGFLAEPETLALYQSYLKRDWPDHWRREYGRPSPSRDGAFFGPFGSEEILGGSSGARPQEVGPDTEMMRVVGALLQILGIWLAASGSKRHDGPTGGPTGRVARDFRTAQDLLGRLRARLAEDNSANDDDIPF